MVVPAALGALDRERSAERVQPVGEAAQAELAVTLAPPTPSSVIWAVSVALWAST
jgi:hypothetical protein